MFVTQNNCTLVAWYQETQHITSSFQLFQVAHAHTYITYKYIEIYNRLFQFITKFLK